MHRRHFLLSLSATAAVPLLSVPSALLAQDADPDNATPLPLFLFAGQSNMVGGRSLAAELPEAYQGESKDVLMFTRDAWQTYQPGLGQSSGFGPEVTCAPDLAAALGGPIGILKYSKGGTNLAKQWNPDDPESLYAVLKRKVDAARASRPIHVVGLFWMQGEADAKDSVMGLSYAENLKHLIACARRDFENPDLFFISGRVTAEPPRVHLDIVRAAQAMDAPGYAWVDCDDLSKVSDHVHYDAAGQALFGQRLAAKALELMKAGEGG